MTRRVSAPTSPEYYRLSRELYGGYRWRKKFGKPKSNDQLWREIGEAGLRIVELELALRVAYQAIEVADLGVLTALDVKRIKKALRSEK